MSTQVIDYAVKRPIGERINFRLVTIVAVFSLLVGYPVFALVRQTLNHGIERTASGYKVDLKSLGNFEFNDQTGSLKDIPQTYRDLDGKEVALEGYMYSDSASPRVNAFQFVYNVSKCCFGGPPLVQERVFAIAPGSGLPQIGDEFRIIGKLHVGLEKDKMTGKITSIYTMVVEKAEPLN
jgi:hypothetical protein